MVEDYIADAALFGDLAPDSKQVLSDAFSVEAKKIFEDLLFKHPKKPDFASVLPRAGGANEVQSQRIMNRLESNQFTVKEVVSAMIKAGAWITLKDSWQFTKLLHSIDPVNNIKPHPNDRGGGSTGGGCSDGNSSHNTQRSASTFASGLTSPRRSAAVNGNMRFSFLEFEEKDEVLSAINVGVAAFAAALPHLRLS